MIPATKTVRHLLVQQFLSALLLACFLLTTTSLAATRTVCDSGCDHATIKAAAQDLTLPSGGIILVKQAKTYNEADIVVTGKTLVSEGGPDGYIINGSGCNNFIISAGSNGAVEGFTITGCAKTDGANGAGVISNGNTVISNVKITGNSNTGTGAGITHTGGGTLNIVNSEVTNNTAVGVSAISSLANDLRINNVKVSGNTSLGPLGFGSVSTVRHRGYSAHIVGLEVTSNTLTAANIAGGGLNINCFQGSQKASILNSIISNNTATGTSSARGGGLNIASCDVDIVGTVISANSLSFAGGTSYGGGVYASSIGRDFRFFAGSSITGNSADSGGGVFCSTGYWKIGGDISGNSQSDTDFVAGSSSCEELPLEIGASMPEAGTSGDPVNTLTGELFDALPPDIELGGPLPLVFSRFYNSALEKNGLHGVMGRNWMHNFDFSLEEVTDFDIEIFSPTGQRIHFLDDGNGGWLRLLPQQSNFQLIDDLTHYTMYDPDQRQFYVFSKATGQLESISDSNGNTHTLTWSGNELSSITDGLGRMLTFSYTSGELTGVTGGGKSIVFSYNSSPELLGIQDARGNASIYVYQNFLSGFLETTIRPELNSPWMQQWDSPTQRVLSQMDASGNVTSFDYDTPNPGDVTMTDPNGNTTRHTHNVEGVLVESVDTSGQITTISPDEANHRSGFTDPLGNNTKVIYGPDSGYATEVTDAEGNKFTFTYEPRTLANGIIEYDLTRADYPDSTFEQWQYDNNGNYTQWTDTAGNFWVYTYNASGNVLTATNPAGGVTSFTYLADGNIDTVTDPAGNTTSNEYDTELRLLKTSFADGSDQQFSYDLNDNLITRTDENGGILSRGFDDNNNRTTTADGSSDEVTLSFDDMDRLAALAPSVGNSSAIGYDSLGRISTLTGPDGNTLTYSYDSRGWVTALNDSMGLLWSATYDDAGRQLTRTNALGHSTSFVWDKAGLLIQTTDPEGTITDFDSDEMGRITSATTAGHSTTFGYDGLGLIDTVQTAPGVTTALENSGLGNVEKLTDALGNEWTFTQDSSGRTVSSQDPLMRSTTYEFDNRNRHNKTVFPAAMGTLDIVHDGRGQITNMNYSDGTSLAYGYDTRDQLLSSNQLTLTRDDLGRVVNSNGIFNHWNAAGMISKITLGGGDVDYDYNARGQLVSVQDWLGGGLDITYDAAGRMLSETHGNGLTTQYSYNKINGVTSIEVRKNSTVIARTDLTRNAIGEISSATRSYPGATAIPNLAALAQNRTFDAAMQAQDMSNDAMGRRTQDSLHDYNWNLASRVTSYTADSGNTNVVLGYDGLGLINSRNDGSGAQSFSWNLAGLRPCLAEMTGSEVRYNICTPNGRLLYSITNGNDHWYYHFDEMGNVQFVSNQNGDVLAVYRYSPFGTLMSDSSHGALNNPFTWQAQSNVLTELDGLYLYRSRAYDARSGRFLSRDPVTGYDPKSSNPYQYAFNNPFLYIDPDGGETVSNMDMFSGGIGVAVAIFDGLNGGSIDKLDDIAKMAGINTPKGASAAKSFKNANRLSAGLTSLGYAAWVLSAWQEIDSTNDKISRSLNQRDWQLVSLTKTYADNINSVTELYRQKKITYFHWRAWMDEVERQFNEGSTSAISSSRLEISQDSIEGLLKAIGSVIVPPSALDCMMKWMGRNVPANQSISNVLSNTSRR